MIISSSYQNEYSLFSDLKSISEENVNELKELEIRSVEKFKKVYEMSLKNDVVFKSENDRYLHINKNVNGKGFHFHIYSEKVHLEVLRDIDEKKFDKLVDLYSNISFYFKNNRNPSMKKIAIESLKSLNKEYPTLVKEFLQYKDKNITIGNVSSIDFFYFSKKLMLEYSNFKDKNINFLTESFMGLSPSEKLFLISSL